MPQICDSKCQYANGPQSDCDCECLGENHGALFAGRALKPVPSNPAPREPPRVGISGREPATMTAGQINREYKQLDELDREATDYSISIGRGDERPSDRAKKTDEFSIYRNEIAARQRALQIETESRYGPKYTSIMGRLPREYGPTKAISSGISDSERAANPGRYTTRNIAGRVYLVDTKTGKIHQQVGTGKN